MFVAGLWGEQEPVVEGTSSVVAFTEKDWIFGILKKQAGHLRSFDDQQPYWKNVSEQGTGQFLLLY